MVKIFVEELIEHVAGQERAEILLKHLIDPAVAEMQERLEAKVAELLAPYTDGFPKTLNPDYNATVAKLDEAENSKAGKGDEDRQRIYRLSCSRLLDCMESYYKIALGVFMDNIALLAIENCVLNDVANLVSAVRIARMSGEEAELLASESPDVVRTRQETLAKMKVLQESLETCQKHVRRRPGHSRNSEIPSNKGSGTSAGANTFVRSPLFRPVTPGLTPASTAGRSSSTSASQSELGIQAFQHSPTPLFTFGTPKAVSDPFFGAQAPGKALE
jgi:hypothetical protein